jgi:hypothetical protein
MAEGVEETFKRLQSHRGVVGVLVINSDGIAIRSTFENDTTVAYAALVSGLAARARSAVKAIAATVRRGARAARVGARGAGTGQTGGHAREPFAVAAQRGLRCGAARARPHGARVRRARAGRAAHAGLPPPGPRPPNPCRPPPAPARAQDELRILRIRSKTNEILIAPEFERGREYCLVVVQEPSAE